MRPEGPENGVESRQQLTAALRRAGSIILIIVLAVGVALVVRNQVKVHRSRQRAAAEMQQRQSLFDLLRPVALSNCTLRAAYMSSMRGTIPRSTIANRTREITRYSSHQEP